MARTSAPRTVHCYHCGRALEVAARAMTTSCPGCFKALRVEDVVVRTLESVRKIQTCGQVIVQKSGRVFANSVEAQEGVQCDGVMEANVISRGPVRIGPKATWKGDCRAASLRVELGGTIIGGYFVIPGDAESSASQAVARDSQ